MSLNGGTTCFFIAVNIRVWISEGQLYVSGFFFFFFFFFFGNGFEFLCPEQVEN